MFKKIIFPVFFFFSPALFATPLVYSEKNSVEIFSSTSVKGNSSLEFTIVYPREGSKIANVKKSFVFGSVKPASSAVLINGSTVNVYPTGSYCAVIPFSSGEFKIKGVAKTLDRQIEIERTVSVSSPAMAYPVFPLTISSESIEPRVNLKVYREEKIFLRLQGSPKAKAGYRLKSLGKKKIKDDSWKKMKETSTPVPGFYEALISLPEDPKIDEFKIEYRLEDKNGKAKKIEAPGKVKILEKGSFVWMEVIFEEAILRTGSSRKGDLMGYELFLPKGVKLKTTKAIGKEIKVELSPTSSYWTNEDLLTPAPQALNSPSVLDSVKVKNGERVVFVEFSLNEKVPYKVNLSRDLKNFSLEFFYSISNLDRVRYEAKALEKLEQVRWSQTQEETLKIECPLKEKVWGYELAYEGNKLILKILFAPPINKKLPLEDINIALDPGHSLKIGDGAIGPQGVPEGEFTYKIAQVLKPILEKSGANVFITRGFEEFPSLGERTARALRQDADLFISLHANALADGSNPFERRGFSLFYFQPQSFEFAKSVHSAFQKMVPLPDDGFYYGNLAVCRATRMPAILVESGYLILPEEEALLLDDRFQTLLAEAIKEGISQFLKSW